MVCFFKKNSRCLEQEINFLLFRCAREVDHQGTVEQPGDKQVNHDTDPHSEHRLTIRMLHDGHSRDRHH